jgi:hypothetical protein
VTNGTTNILPVRVESKVEKELFWSPKEKV